MRFNKVLLFLIFTIFLTATQPSNAISANQGKMVRVGISDVKFQNYYYNTINITATDSFRLTDKATNSIIADFGALEDVNITIKDNCFNVKQGTTTIANGLEGPITAESDNGFVTVKTLNEPDKTHITAARLRLLKHHKKLISLI